MSGPQKPSALRPRKRPRQPRSAETVAAILEAAARVLEASGLEGFNTNAVARRAGVSIGSLYQYFPNKEALTIALIRRETERFQADAVRALEGGSGAASMSHFIAAAVRHQLRRPVLARLLDIEESRPEFRGELSGLQAYEQLLVTILLRGDLPAQACPEVAAGDILAIMRGIIDAAGERSERDLDDLGRRVRAAVFGYLAGTASGNVSAGEPAPECEQVYARRNRRNQEKALLPASLALAGGLVGDASSKITSFCSHNLA